MKGLNTKIISWGGSFQNNYEYLKIPENQLPTDFVGHGHKYESENKVNLALNVHRNHKAY